MPVGRLVLAVLLALAGCTVGVDPAADPTPAPGAGIAATVTEVVDGDTVKVAYRNGTRDTVRLVGVDTPEIYSENTPEEYEGVPETAAGRRCLRRWGERASAHATDRLRDRRVRLAFDPNLDRRGYYDRLLAYVVLENRTFNYALVTEGYARVYDSDFSRKSRYLDAERRAREGGTGLWECATDSPPTATPGAGMPVSDGGSALAIAEINADAPGNDNENLNEEYVTLLNRGETAVLLEGWTVTDEAGKEYVFGDVTLDPGARVTLHTGSGTDTATDVYWGRTGAVWNNGGDTVTVRAANGTVVTERTYR
jgi:micrococcal nuclease